MPDLVISCAAGSFRGVATTGAEVWRGIRYAAPPIGARRWRDPEPPVPEESVVDATAPGAAAPQVVTPAISLGEGARIDEDCLFLNVWRPADSDGPLPVMVWIHGGAYTFGSGTQPLYDGTSLVTNGRVVVVTLNYRIGALGFLDLSSLSTPEEPFDGNLAVKDLLLALAWVRDNIAAFGGDPDRVTIFGESAGGGLVTTLLATPSAAGLFHGAIAESSPASSVYGAERARRVADRFLELTSATPETARGLPVAAIVDATTALFAAVPGDEPGTLAFAPVVDGDLIPEAPVAALRAGRGIPVPLLIGTNHDEASLFRFMKSPLMPIAEDSIDRMFANLHREAPDVDLPPIDQVRTAYEGVRHRALGLGIARDIGFRLPTLWVAEGHSTVAPVWLYRFDHTTPMLRLLQIGASHGTELAYVWGNLSHSRKDPTFRLGGRRLGQRVSARIQARWAAFAHGESPDAVGAADWTAFTLSGRATLVIDDEDRIVADLDAALRSAWGDEVLAFP